MVTLEIGSVVGWCADVEAKPVDNGVLIDE